MNATPEIYLDIETDWGRGLTVVGFHSNPTGLVQLVGGDITAERLARELPPDGTLYTFNGHCFDVPCVRKQLGIDLRGRFRSIDLRFVCQRRGLRGGQKAVERCLGVRRALPDLDGIDAMVLWSRFQRGDREALRTLLHYNDEDVRGLIIIKECLAARGWL